MSAEASAGIYAPRPRLIPNGTNLAMLFLRHALIVRDPTSMEEETSATRNPKTNLLETLIEGHGRSWTDLEDHER